MSILNDTWKFPRCLCCSFPFFFSSWELSSNQRWLWIQEQWNVRQLNYNTCNTGVAFPNGCTTAFGFFSLSRGDKESPSAFPVEKAHLSACCTSTDACGKVFYSGNDSYPQEWWDIASIGFNFSQNCLVPPLAFSAWNQDKLVKIAPAVFCLCRGNQTRGNTLLRIPSGIWIP